MSYMPLLDIIEMDSFPINGRKEENGPGRIH